MEEIEQLIERAKSGQYMQNWEYGKILAFLYLKIQEIEGKVRTTEGYW